MYLSQTSHLHHKWLGSVALKKSHKDWQLKRDPSAKAPHAKGMWETILWWGPDVGDPDRAPQATLDTFQCVDGWQ